METKNKLMKIFNDRFQTNLKYNDIIGKNFLSDEIGLGHRELFILFMEIEKEFSISFSKTFIDEQKFLYIDSIYNYLVS